MKPVIHDDFHGDEALLEIAKLEREAWTRVHVKMAAEQLGEAFADRASPIDFPHRLAIGAPIGSLLKRVEPRRPSQKSAHRNPDYLARIRELPCLSCGMDPCGCAAHIRMQSAAFGKTGGMARKPADRWSAPVCNSCHLEDRNALHKVGEAIFWNDLGINPLLVATRLWAAKDDPVRMRAIALLAIAERHR